MASAFQGLLEVAGLASAVISYWQGECVQFIEFINRLPSRAGAAVPARGSR